MTTEKLEEKSGEQTENQNTEGENKDPEYTPIQLKAIDQGWIPREEFDGEEEDFIDAAEFVRRGELFAKISSQSTRIKQVEQALTALRDHNSRIKQAEYERALKSLKQAKRTAQVAGETEQVFQLEDKIEEVEAEREEIRKAHEAQAQPDGPSDEFLAWKEANPWYDKDEILQDAADALGRRLKAKGMSNDEILKQVASRIREEFPHKFGRKTGARAPSPDAPRRGTGKSSGDDVAMTDWEKDMMKKIVRVGGITEAEYKAQLKTIKERG